MIVTSIATGHWLDKPAALSWFRMVRDANGVVKSSEITDAGRTYEEQVRLFTSRYSQVNTGIDYRFWKGKPWWRKVGVASVATPGTSNHETGRAVDLSGKTREWVRTHGADYGWIKGRVSNEPWHIEYIESRDSKKTQGVTDVELTDKLGVNPATGKASSVGEKIDIAGNYSFYNWNYLRDILLVKLPALEAQIKGLVGAVNALANDEDFDEAKLLAGVRTASETGARAGATTILREIEGIIRETAGINAESVLDALRERL